MYESTVDILKSRFRPTQTHIWVKYKVLFCVGRSLFKHTNPNTYIQRTTNNNTCTDTMTYKTNYELWVSFFLSCVGGLCTDRHRTPHSPPAGHRKCQISTSSCRRHTRTSPCSPTCNASTATTKNPRTTKNNSPAVQPVSQPLFHRHRSARRIMRMHCRRPQRVSTAGYVSITANDQRFAAD